jgi:hypothetical protein
MPGVMPTVIKFIPIIYSKLFNELLKSESVGRPMESGNADSIPEKFQKILVGKIERY